MTTRQKLIEIKDLEKNFGNQTVLKNLNWTVFEGERVGILGANGAGKTTLVEMVAQISQPSKGEIKVYLDGNLKSQIGIQFQKGEWIIGLTPRDILNFYRRVFPHFNEAREKELEEIFEINEFIRKPLTRLSGGQQQRFNAMLSVLNKPKIIILDELTVGLDMELQFKILNFFKKITREPGQTLLIVSHNPEEVEMLCNRMVIVGQQKLLFDDSIVNVKKKYGSVRNLMIKYFEGKFNDEII